MIKYGCLRSAWASDILVCPVLEWAGPTRQELLNYHKTLIMATSGASRYNDAVQKEWSMRGLLESEETLRSELQSIHDTGNKFSLASLSHRNPGSMEEWLILKTNAQTNTETVKRKNAAELRSQEALNFSNARNTSSIMASEPTTPSHQNMNENPAINSTGMARERIQMLRNMRLA
ncbi:hypothetical protein XANCAGTX0491_008493 [Xanthoria calcicola]